MSTDDYNRKLEEGRKLVNILKRDMKYREQQQKKAQTTYSIDSEIKGSLSQLDQIVERIEYIFNNFRAKPQDFGFTNKEIDKRQQQYEQISSERINLRRQYDSYFQKKANPNPVGTQPAPANKPDFSQMNSKQLVDHKAKQEQDQEQVLDELLNVVKNTKQGAKVVGKELNEQDVMLDNLEKGMDDNMQNIGRVRKNMMKLLDSSSNLCLIIVILLEIAGLICSLLLWH